MSQPADSLVPLALLTPELKKVLMDQTNHRLLKIIKANSNSRYALQAPPLSDFRRVTSARGMDDDDTLLEDFRGQVPLTDYEPYKPFVDDLLKGPCKLSEIENLFSPGLPEILAQSSCTTGKERKVFAKYRSNQPLQPKTATQCTPKLTAWVYYYGYDQIVEIQDERGHTVKRIPVCPSSGGTKRIAFDWPVDDDSVRMTRILPGHVTPWAASMIAHDQPFFLIHGLFCLTNPDVEQFCFTLSSIFVDFIQAIDEQWDMLMTAIRDGILPKLAGAEHVHDYLKAQFFPNVKRAEQLREIGPPSSVACGGGFATPLQRIRSILGPSVTIRSRGYGATECYVAESFGDTLDTFVVVTEDIVEFLEVHAEKTHENLIQAWDLEVGKHYEIVLTTRDGLWRYMLGDVVEIVGFHPDNGSPVFHYAGRASFSIRIPHYLVPDTHLLAAIQAISTKEILQVHEFTTLMDDRKSPATIGYIVEILGELGPNSHLAPQKLFEAFAAIFPGYKNALERGKLSLPTIRIVKPGTFMEYRQWRGRGMNIGVVQRKVPVVLNRSSAAEEWVLERVVMEL